MKRMLVHHLFSVVLTYDIFSNQFLNNFRSKLLSLFKNERLQNNNIEINLS